jgi:DNA-binding NarL/FixJ family response regulator
MRILAREETVVVAEPAPSRVRLQRTLSPTDEQRKLRVLVVDDEDVVHWGFRMLLGNETWVEAFAAAHTSEEAVELAGQHEPHVAVVDVLLQRESGINVCKQIRDASPGTRVLLMSGRDTLSTQTARAMGASGFVPKNWGAHDLVGATRMVGLGMTVFASDPPSPTNPLSQREREVLEMLAAGATNREIAARLFLSPHTVKDHTSALYKKINARNRADAIMRAQRMGLIG